MINLKNPNTYSILPYNIRDSEIKSFCELIDWIISRVHQFTKGLEIWYSDETKEEVLDYLSQEMQVFYYDKNLDARTKEELVKKSFMWHANSGTIKAVSEMADVIFGKGEITEWFNEEDGVPGTFRITTQAAMTQDMEEYFYNIISGVKNIRSHISQILIKRDISTTQKNASTAYSVGRTVITNESNIEDDVKSATVSLGACNSHGRQVINNAINSKSLTNPETCSNGTISISSGRTYI